MQFEVIRKNHKKEIIIGVIVLLTIAIVFIVQLSFAKYKTVKNVPIVSGTVNYKIPDFNIIAMYKQKDGNSCTEDSCYEEITGRMPTSGYEINESKSYCTLDNINKDTEAKLFTNENGGHEFKNLAKNEKCYVYFDVELPKIYGSSGILANITVKTGTPDFSKVATSDEGVYKAQDDDGETYYWRGSVTNNYVKFAGFYWRIIRINGNGSIRLIYDGTSARANGSMLNVDSGVFNTSQSGNAYIGFKYDEGSPHGLGQKSNILKILENWYVTNLTNYESKLDINSSFCGDRNSNTIEGEMPNETVGAGTDKTYYGAKYRLNTQKNPSLKCSNINDLYTISKASKGNKSLTYPIGLITADEVAMAGGLWGTANSNYYLYIGTGQYYWTLSPYTSNSNYANLFLVSSSGSLTAGGQATVSRSYGIRQVINLKSNTVFTGTGTMNDPYVVI